MRRTRTILSRASFAALVCVLLSCNPLGNRSTINGGDGSGANGAIYPVLVSASQVTTSPFTVEVSWSAPVTGFTLSDLQVTNGSAANFAGSRADYTFDITPTAEGTVTITIPAAAARDLPGKPSDATVLTMLYDSTPPSVTVNKTGSSPTASLPAAFAVVFSEAIEPTSFTTSDITQNGSATGITWTILDSGDHQNFTLSATAVTGDGSIRPSLGAGVVEDLVGNPTSASTSTNNTVIYFSNYASIKLWLCADSLSVSNGASVTSWSDISTSTVTVTEVTNPPTFLTPAQNSLPAVRFTGGSQILRSTGNSGISGNPDMTVFVVARVNGSGTNYPVFLQIGEASATGLSGWFGLDSLSANIFAGFYGGGNRSTSNYLAGFNIYTWVRSSGGGTNNTQNGNSQYWNGSAAATTTSLSAGAVNITNGAFRIGRSTVNTTINGDIGEILLFSGTALNATQRGYVENYLNNKWALY